MIRSARAPAVAAGLGRGGVGVGVGNAAGLAGAAPDDGAPARVRGILGFILGFLGLLGVTV